MLTSLFAYNDVIFDKLEENFKNDFIPELEYKVDLKTLGKYDQASVVNSFEYILGQHNIQHEKEISEDFFIDGERYTLFKNSLTQTTKKRVIDIKVNGEISDLFESKVSFSFEKNNAINGKSLYEAEGGKGGDFLELHEDIRQIWNDKAEKVVKEWNKGGEGMRRKKNRRSYLFSQFVKIDVTDVNTMSMNGKNSSSRELEVELISDIDKDTLEHFSEAVRFVGNLIETICLIKDYNNWTSFPETKRENYKEFIIGNSSQPRNFKKGDFVWGGLIPVKDPGTIYSVTIKSDGLRKNLVIHPSGIWTVRPKRGGAPIADKLEPLVCRCKGGEGVHTQFCPVSYLGSVVDGELMDDGNFIPFDILSYRRNSSVQSLSHLPMNPGESSRLLVAKTVCDSISKTYPSSPFKILYKKFFSLGRTRDKMVDSLIKCEQYMNNFGRPNDGYIFTPINYKYRSEGGTSLHEIPDTCKLKPWEKLSIDFFFSSVDKVPKVYDKGVLVSFLNVDGFSSENYIIPPFLDITVEMEPVREKDDERVVMVFSRVREDKGANSMKVARDVWRDIQDPIFLSDLRGETFRFNRLFQNKVKSHLIENVTKGSYVLDIGSGNGGDLGKYTKRGVAKLFAVDPNEDNMREFQRRLSNMKTKASVKTLLAGGEESEVVIESSYNFFNDIEPSLFKSEKAAPSPAPPLYITMMLSLSFFWKSPEMLSGLADTIKKATERHNGNVYFLFYTIEGGRTLEFFDKYGTNDVKVGPVDLRLKPNERILLLDYPNSIVGKQTEYLVNLDDLANLLGVEFNIVDTSPELMEDGEYILSQNEINYSSMYVAGFAKLK